MAKRGNNFYEGYGGSLADYEAKLSKSNSGGSSKKRSSSRNSRDRDDYDVQQVDLEPVYNAIGDKPQQEFQLSEMRDLMNQQQQAGGGDVPVAPERFQNTQQIGQLINQMNDVLAPLTQSQQQAAQTGFNQNLQKLNDQWASRGLLASGGAAAQQRQSADALISQLSQIEAQQQANAIPLAFNFANLGLNESQQRFGQQMANREFDLTRSQQGVGNMQNALGFQENQLQNYLNNLMGAKNMEMGQNQWAQGFTEGQYQYDTGLDENQYQYDTNFNEQQRQYDNNLALQMSQMLGEINGQPTLENQQWQASMTGRMPLDNNLQGLVSTLLQAKQSNEAGGITPEQRQQNTQMADTIRQQLSMYGVDPAMFGSGVGYQEALGNVAGLGQTLPSQQQTFNQGVTEAGLTGQYQGQPTMDTQMAYLNALNNFADKTPFLPGGMGNAIQGAPNFSGLGGMLSGMEGQPSQNTYGQNLQDALSRFQTEQNLAFDREMNNISNLFSVWEQTGQAPSGLENYGVQPGTQLRDFAQQDATNAALGKIATFTNESDAQRFIQDNLSDLIESGVNMSQLLQQYGSMWSQENGSSSNDIMEQAIKMAQEDDRFQYAESQEERQQVINEYYDLLNPQ